jgi:hypothetical protein
MPVTGKLTALKVAREKRPGLYGDGGGLYLQVTARGSKSWIFRFWIAERDLTTGNVVRDPRYQQNQGSFPRNGLRFDRHSVIGGRPRLRVGVP